MNSAAWWLPMLAQQDTSSPVRTLEFDWPTSPWQWGIYLGALTISLLLVLWVYRRDWRDLHPGWRAWLLLLRLSVFVVLAIILFNPQERTQKSAYRPSRAVVLFDTSLSQGFPESVSEDDTGDPAVGRSRSEAVKAAFKDGNLLEELRKQHEVTIYTFDSELSGKHHVIPSLEQQKRSQEAQAADEANGGAAAAGSQAAETTAAAAGKMPAVEFDELLRPRGLETRLGESLLKLIEQESGRTLSGVVVVTDGASNAGVDHLTANGAARQSKVRLIAAGVGSTRKQANLKIAGLQAPTDVHVGDPYEITGFLQGTGLAGRPMDVELLVAPDGEENAVPVVVEKREVMLLEDGIPVEVKFTQTPTIAAKLKYTVRAKPSAKVREADETDNAESTSISIVDKKTRVLIIAGGPMRDYHFVRNMLYRHKAVRHDIWLQSVLPETASKVSQESENLLIAFPDNAADLFQYDVIIGFDVDWTQIPSESLKLLNRWVSEESGGLILIAGDVNTPMLASPTEATQPIVDLYPVFLGGTEFAAERDADQPWPMVFSREGEEAGFLQLTDDQQTSAQKWKEFEGVFTCYPSTAEKSGTTVYARFPDPRTNSGGKQPVVMASHFFGSGRVFYIGTGELWRLRALSDDCAEYDRLWTKVIREVGQERLTRGTQRAMLMPERDKYYIGQTVRVRARVLDPQFKPLESDSVPLDVIGPDRRPLSPARKLDRDKNRAGQYMGDFRVTLPGKYTIELRLPETNEREVREINVRVPDIESEQREQNAALLTDLVRDTGGKYLSLAELVKELPALLPNQGETFIADERRRSLWDRDWILYALIGVLSLEWLTRKLLKLA